MVNILHLEAQFRPNSDNIGSELDHYHPPPPPRLKRVPGWADDVGWSQASCRRNVAYLHWHFVADVNNWRAFQPRVQDLGNSGRWANIDLILGQRRRRWPSIKPTLGPQLVHAVERHRRLKTSTVNPSAWKPHQNQMLFLCENLRFITILLGVIRITVDQI